jgi:hypothetical protein
MANGERPPGLHLAVPFGMVVLFVAGVAAVATGRLGETPAVTTPDRPMPTAPGVLPAESVDPGTPSAGAASPSPPSAEAVLVGAGDIASCGSNADEATARLLDAIEGTVFTAGDNAYGSGTARQFARCYDPTWGRHRERTLPALGNHEYQTSAARGYFGYFGAAAGEPGRGFYAVDVGSWRVIVLNSNCDAVACGTDSSQAAWLRDELASRRADCTVAIWHHPRFSSGEHGVDLRTAAFWDALYAAGADVIVTGHDHDYERFGPQDPNGEPDEDQGIRQFVVGTGGASLRGFGGPVTTSEVREARTHGVLELSLRTGNYDWRFVPVAGRSFSDAGSDTCH